MDTAIAGDEVGIRDEVEEEVVDGVEVRLGDGEGVVEGVEMKF